MTCRDIYIKMRHRCYDIYDITLLRLLIDSAYLFLPQKNLMRRTVQNIADMFPPTTSPLVTGPERHKFGGRMLVLVGLLADALPESATTWIPIRFDKLLVRV